MKQYTINYLVNYSSFSNNSSFFVYRSIIGLSLFSIHGISKNLAVKSVRQTIDTSRVHQHVAS